MIILQILLLLVLFCAMYILEMFSYLLIDTTFSKHKLPIMVKSFVNYFIVYILVNLILFKYGRWGEGVNTVMFIVIAVSLLTNILGMLRSLSEKGRTAKIKIYAHIINKELEKRGIRGVTSIKLIDDLDYIYLILYKNDVTLDNKYAKRVGFISFSHALEAIRKYPRTIDDRIEADINTIKNNEDSPNGMTVYM